MLFQLILLPLVLVAAKSTTFSGPTNKTGKGTVVAPISISENRDPFGMRPAMVKMIGSLPKTHFRLEPRKIQKPAENVSLPIIPHHHHAPHPVNMFPGLLDDMMLRSMFDAMDDMTSNERTGYLPLNILDTNPDLPGSKPAVKNSSPRPGAIRATPRKSSTWRSPLKTSPAVRAGNKTVETAGNKTVGKTGNSTTGSKTTEKLGNKTIEKPGNKTVEKAGNKTASKNNRVKRGYEAFSTFDDAFDSFFRDSLQGLSDMKASIPEQNSANFSDEPVVRIRAYHDVPNPFFRYGISDPGELKDSIFPEPVIRIRTFRNSYNPFLRDESPDPKNSNFSSESILKVRTVENIYDPFFENGIPDPSELKDLKNATFSQEPVLKIQTYRTSSFGNMPPSVLLLRLGFRTRSDLTSKSDESTDNSTKSAVFCRFGSQEFSIYKCSALVYILFMASVLISGYIILRTRKCEIQRKCSVVRI